MTEPTQIKKDAANRVQHVRFTANLSLTAYDAIIELQRIHRKGTGRAIPVWKILDTAVIAYAKRQGIKSGK